MQTKHHSLISRYLFFSYLFIDTEHCFHCTDQINTQHALLFTFYRRSPVTKYLFLYSVTGNCLTNGNVFIIYSNLHSEVVLHISPILSIFNLCVLSQTSTYSSSLYQIRYSSYDNYQSLHIHKVNTCVYVITWWQPAG